MICKKYEVLTTKEKIEYTGRLLHAIMNREKYFDIGMAIIDAADKEGLFDNIEIMPELPKDDLFEKIVLGGNDIALPTRF